MDRLAENRSAEPGLDGVLKYGVDLAAEQLFQKNFEVHIGVEGLLFELDDEIQIAVLSAFPASPRSK